MGMGRHGLWPCSGRLTPGDKGESAGHIKVKGQSKHQPGPPCPVLPSQPWLCYLFPHKFHTGPSDSPGVILAAPESLEHLLCLLLLCLHKQSSCTGSTN